MVEIIPRQKVKGIVTSVLKAAGADFVSTEVDQLELTYEGIAGDYHAGQTRLSGVREPWYESGIEMRNERQLSILAGDEMCEIAENLNIRHLKPGWIGANLVIDGIENFSLLPPRSVLIFEGGVTLRVDGYNGPCRFAGASVAKHLSSESRSTDGIFDASKSDIALEFAQAARLKRGVVAWVEREGIIKPGEKVVGHVWEQWLYQ
ncbi:MAG: MOSC domain-containing protein [Hyphomicrobiales bacterium]|nr:MOSC domain-containing protein [Hyphomicrobiales bacterium]